MPTNQQKTKPLRDIFITNNVKNNTKKFDFVCLFFCYRRVKKTVSEGIITDMSLE